MQNKKGQFQSLNVMAVGLVSFILLVAIAGIVLDDFRDTTTANTAARNVTDDGLSAVEDLGDWATTLISIGVGIVIIGLIAGFGYALRGRR